MEKIKGKGKNSNFNDFVIDESQCVRHMQGFVNVSCRMKWSIK